MLMGVRADTPAYVYINNGYMRRAFLRLRVPVN